MRAALAWFGVVIVRILWGRSSAIVPSFSPCQAAAVWYLRVVVVVVPVALGVIDGGEESRKGGAQRGEGEV